MAYSVFFSLLEDNKARSSILQLAHFTMIGRFQSGLNAPSLCARSMSDGLMGMPRRVVQISVASFSGCCQVYLPLYWHHKTEGFNGGICLPDHIFSLLTKQLV